MELRLELVPIAVSDIERAKAFYEQAGFTLEVDVEPREGMRVVQFTPPGSACSIVFGTGMPEISDMEPGSTKGLHLVVTDMEEARNYLIDRGIQVTEAEETNRVLYAYFRDPEGNSWLLQQFPAEAASEGGES